MDCVKFCAIVVPISAVAAFIAPVSINVGRAGTAMIGLTNAPVAVAVAVVALSIIGSMGIIAVGGAALDACPFNSAIIPLFVLVGAAASIVLLSSIIAVSPILCGGGSMMWVSAKASLLVLSYFASYNILLNLCG